MSSPAAWHHDPSGRHELRYWDGAAWTDHVSDDGVVGVDPLTAASTSQDAAEPAAQVEGPPGRTVLLDVQVRAGLSHQRLFMDQDALWWKGKAVPFASVDGVAWWVTNVVAGPAHNFEYRLRLWQGKQKTTVAFAGRSPQVRAVYDAAVRVLREHVELRMLEDALRRIEAGQSVACAGWILTSAGATQGKKQFTWGARLRLSASQRFPWVYVWVSDGAKEREAGTYSPEAHNAALLPELFKICEQRYGG